MRTALRRPLKAIDIRELALEQGFDAVGFAAAQTAERTREALREFILAGHHGDMGWMETREAERSSPNLLWPDAKSAIVLAMSYAPADDPLAALQQNDRATISVYAKGSDYHELIKKRLKTIARALVAKCGGGVKVFVDTAPLMEKPLAQAAGIGWQGKHTNLVSREHGSWLFLGVILTTLEINADESEPDHCGTCQRCLDVCPTKAFPTPYKLDARRCISYLTIEHKGPIPRELRPLMGNRIYGCDDCLAVCPWNKFAAASRETAFHARAELNAVRLADLAKLDDQSFRALFRNSPVKRIGRDRFMRNILIAIGNSNDQTLVKSALALLEDPSALVRSAAIWALSRLMTELEFSSLRDEWATREHDAVVLEEWQAA